MTFLKRAEQKGRKYLNPVPTTTGGLSLILKVLPLYLSNREEAEPNPPLPAFRTDPAAWATPPAGGLRVTWFGHSGFLIELDGLRILVDPVWEERASPVQFFGPKRFFPPTLSLEDLPPIDCVLVSHDHYDHLGAQTIRRLSLLNATARARWVTSAGVGKRLRKFGVPDGHITELDWTQSVEVAGADLGPSVTITSMPARHFSGRGLIDRYSTLWASFVLEGPKHRVYFGADSGYWPGFGEIARRFGRFDLVMLEVGAFHPLWAQIHMGPDGAAKSWGDIAAAVGRENAGLLMPIHWGLFNLALHGWRWPVERIEELASAEGIPLWLPEPGRPTEVVPATPLRSGWWERRRG